MKYTDEQLKKIKESLVEQECCFNCVYTGERSDDVYEWCNILNEYVLSISKCSEHKKID
ncbi:MAG: hypothetical protein ACRCX2_14490 [Paraclostridium sp.]